MVIWLAAVGLAHGGGFEVEGTYRSSWGPDAYGLVRTTGLGGDGLRVGALVVGGTRTAAAASFGRRLSLHDRVSALAELQLGMVRTAGADPGGPTGGFDSDVRVDLDPVTTVVELGYLHGVGTRSAFGVDAALTPTWTLTPRLLAETWAGDRDVGLRVGMGTLCHDVAGLQARLMVSVGGRDVNHMGPGLTLALGREP